MSKRKRKRKNAKTANIPPATTLRLRLGNLWADTVLLHKDDEAIEQDLNAVARNIAPDVLVRTMLQVYLSTSATARTRLGSVLPRWLNQHSHISVLQEMTANLSLGNALRPTALAWMEAVGVDTKQFERLPDLFIKAYYYDDAAIHGEKSQAAITVFWHTSPRRKRAQSIGLLLDYNPPWDGSVKDALVTSPRSPKRLLRDVLAVWRQGDMEPESISAERAKTIMLTALNCNRSAGIRLPRDLIAARDVFERYVLALAGAPDTPSFTMDGFDFLSHNGQRPEEIVRFERTVGRRVRVEDGKEMVVMGSPDWGTEEW
jgi:hypothetical protein